MAKMTREKFIKLKGINENGFTINLGGMLNNFYDNYEKFHKNIVDNEQKTVFINIEFKKCYKSAYYQIEVVEYKKDTVTNSDGKKSQWLLSGTGYFEKELLKEESKRYSFKRLREICGLVTDGMIKEVLQEYEDFITGKSSKYEKRPINLSIVK
ncbi:MAG: hypothetical protein ACM3O3_13080 [Syntrophothermus sp.]